VFILSIAQCLMSLHESPGRLQNSHPCNEPCFDVIHLHDGAFEDCDSDTSDTSNDTPRDIDQFTGRNFVFHDMFSTCCAICHASKFTVSKRLKCGHRFCLQCINEWTQINASCPLCRDSFLVIPWPSVCIACGEKDCKNPHIELQHEIIIEYIEPE
jgi:hypothetical protein